jgi:hypothetical protein
MLREKEGKELRVQRWLRQMRAPDQVSDVPTAPSISPKLFPSRAFFLLRFQKLLH